MGKDWHDPPTPAPGAAAAHFQYSRTPRDRLWGVLFGLTWAACIVGGIYSITHRNPAFLHTDFTDPASCPYTKDAAHRALMETLAKEHAADWSLGDFMHLAGGWLATSALLALGLGLLFIHLFKHHASLMTRATIWGQVAFPAAMAVLLLVAGQAFGALAFAGMAALSAFVFFLWRGEIELATRLLGVSAHGLVANGGIVTATVALNLASMLAIAPLFAFLAFAFMNGEPVPNPERHGAAECVSAQGAKVLCCSWEPTQGAQAYMGLAGATVLWTMLLANQIRVFVTSGAVAQWYFAPAGLGAPRGTTLRSLKHAMGPSFGSLCFSSLVLTIAQMARDALERSQESDGEFNLLKCLFICLAQCFWSIVEYLTKFATVLMAITGEAFLAAGRHVTDLLLRNLLNAFASTIWFTPLVIRMACFLLASGWGLLSGGAFFYLHRSGEVGDTAGLNAAILGTSIFVITFFVLSFVGGILLSVLDAVFICWAIDKDSQTVSHPEVYTVLQSVPLPGAVVQQPDGDVLYGAGTAAERQPLAPPHQYQPPSVTHV